MSPTVRWPRIGLLSAWLSRNNGGVFEALVAHAQMVRSAGFEPVVLGLADEHSAADQARFGSTEVTAASTRGPRMFGHAPALLEALHKADVDLIHLHGIWTDVSRVAARWASATRKPYVISPHGMLDPWILGRGRSKKAMARAAYERRSWARASAFHALTAAESTDVESATGRRGVAAVIPNAVEAAAGAEEQRGLTFLYLGRIHPKKNVEALVDAWDMVSRPPHARLVIAGWGSDGDIASLARKTAAASQVEFVGPQFGDAKVALLREARFLCLPSHSEGLPMAILEAWAQGTPTLMSRHCHLDQGFAAGAALDCGTDVKQIAATLQQALSADHSRWAGMSKAALNLVREHFSLAIVTSRWKSLYDGLLNGQRR